MSQGTFLLDRSLALPSVFFERLILDIPVGAWVELFQRQPALRRAVLEGFSGRSDKLQRLLRQPQLVARLRRALQADRGTLEEVLQLWSQEQLSTLAFLEMLDRAFLLENWDHLKDFIGPERFLACLHLLGVLDGEGVAERIQNSFWERHIADDIIEPLLPVWMLWREFVQQHPGASDWLEGMLGPPAEPKKGAKESLGAARREEELRRKLEAKLEKAKGERERFEEQVSRYREENEALRKRLAEGEEAFEQRVEEAMGRQRAQWFQRYEGLEPRILKEAEGRLQSLLARADRAFELQKKADEEYGLAAAVRQELMRVELYLAEIERIYADSLVVHKEVTRVKEALLKEKKRLLQLPGIDRVLGKERPKESVADLRRRVHLIEAVPQNLTRIIQLESLVKRLEALGFIEDAEPLQEDIAHKKRQILEALYASFLPPKRLTAQGRSYRSFEEFVQSGAGRKFDLYVDGYNVLLKIQPLDSGEGATSLTALREEFIKAVCDKGSLFRRIFMVFDGVEDSRDRMGNVEIIYTDKLRGTTADMVIIHEIGRRKDKQSLLVTEDQEVIRATEQRVYAVVNPYHFYFFVLDIRLPPLGGR